MKTLIIIFIQFVFLASIHSQNGCDPLLNSNIPPSPYIDGYITFDGKGDFLRTNDLNGLEFPSNSTDSFTISTRLKITKPYAAQYIFGKRYSDGWIFGCNTNASGYVSIYLGSEWKNIYNLGSDTSWHKYEVKYYKQGGLLKMFTDDILTFTYNNFYYSGMQDNSAFSVGNVGFFPQYGPQTVNLYSQWFKGSIAFIKVSSNQSWVVNYGFNEGGGQVARDSISYYYSDRTYPGSTTCGASHLMLGYMPSTDTCDISWSAFDNPVESRFSPLGTGTQYWYSGPNGEYYADHFSIGMTTWNGKLINTGYFNLAGGTAANYIAAWDGNSWSPLGSGLNHEAVGLCSYNGELFATGFFDTADGNPASYIAKWDGSNWQPVGAGLDNVGNVMCEYNGDLIVGGWFFCAGGGDMTTYIARWDGRDWHGMKVGMDGPVYALCVYNGNLYAGGNFHTAGGEICNGIAMWDGVKWHPVGNGIAGGDATIYSLQVYNGELYAGGAFIVMDNIMCYNIAKYNGSLWQTAGGATGAYCNVSQGYVSSLKVCRNELYAAGQFAKMNGVTANKLAKFNGAGWCQVEYGVDLRPRSMEVYQDNLIINGDFHSASGVACNNIVSYTPQAIITGTGNYNVPVNFSLAQNYPNPFNPKTKIKYSIAPNTNGQMQSVKLVVYDITGRESRVLVNEYQSAGNYEIDFDGSSFASGIYLYKLVTGQYTETKKMVLIK